MSENEPETPQGPQQEPPSATPAGTTSTPKKPRAASAFTQKAYEKCKTIATQTASGTGRFFNWLAGALTSRTSMVILGLVLAYAFLPVDKLIQSVESRFHDHFYFNPAREGVIVVDTPQLFTRERLINERLEESAWIEKQLDQVDQLLKDGKFAKVDSVSVTKNLLSLLGKEDAAGLEEVDVEKLSALAKELGVTNPTPLQQFRDAKNYRERLSLQRYDSILDDAHDIGSNTLHRMNFRLTLSPARTRSDSVAAVSITVREPRDSRLLFDHYGRLMVETRKKMEETVASLLRDRMLILTRDFQFQTSELELIDKILHSRVMKLELTGEANQYSGLNDITRDAEELVDHLIDLILEQQIQRQEAQAQAYLHTLVSSIGIPELTGALMPNYPEKRPTYWNDDGNLSNYTMTAARKLIESCGAPFRLTNLSPEDFSQNDKRYFAVKNLYIDNQLNAASGPPPNGPGKNGGPPPEQDPSRSVQAKAPGSDQQLSGMSPEGIKEPDNQTSVDRPSPANANRPPPTKEQLEALQNAKRQLSDNFENSLRQPFTYPCPTRENQITLAKLRLLGRLEMLERTGSDSFVNCKVVLGLREKLIAFIGGEMPSKSALSDMRKRFHALCPGSDLLEVTELLANRVDLSGGDYARIGIVMTMKEKLSNLQLDTSSRNVKLGMFFDFDVTRCDLKTCKLRTRSKAEALAEGSINSREHAYRVLSKENPTIHELTLATKEVKQSIEPITALALAGLDKSIVPVKATTLGRIDNVIEHKLQKAQELGAQLSQLEKRIQEAGREEALRLFLELRCFADARSYTVWPRSGERLASFERDSQQSGARFDFDSTLQKFTGLQASTNSSTVMRQERDHIFGIGDWGSRDEKFDDQNLKPCSRELEAVLDNYEPKGKFVEDFTSRLADNSLGQNVTSWWKLVIALYTELKLESCGPEPCELNREQLLEDMRLEDLMEIAQGLELPNTQTKFSWIIAPRRETPRRASRHVPMSVPLSALISLPSWWGHAELEIATCWIRPKDLRARIPTGNLCDVEASSKSQATRHTMHVPLPGKAQDVLQRIGFFIIRTPYLDTNWNQEEEVEAGRPAKIRLTGSRLWKNPRVRIGNQWHDKIEVLPNMQGVIASFECVQPTLRPGKLSVRLGHEDLPRFGEKSDAQYGMQPECKDENGAMPVSDGPPEKEPEGEIKQNTCRPKASASEELYVDNRQAEIWTSEGRTSPTVVKVHAFRPRYFRNGEIERPCWLLKDDMTGQTSENGGNGQGSDQGSKGQ